jgi:hypothetical protein
VWGAVLTGLSLPLPILMAVLLYFRRVGGVGLSIWELILAMGAIVLPSLAGTILGWMALSDIGAHRGKLRGTPLAVFAAVTWPALALAAFTVWLVVAPARNFSATAPLASFLLLLVPAGMLTFLIWAVYATINKVAGEPVTHRRGVLKWAFISLLLSGIGYVLVLSNKPQRRSSEAESATIAPDIASIASQGPTDSNAWIRFTFTAVELRDVAGTRWLAIDYVDDVHGECQKAFPWEANIPGFKAETRTSAFLKQDKDSPQVRHQRIEYRMPDSAPRDQLEKLRENLEETLRQKSVRLELGENESPFLLFELPGAEGGSFKAWVKVVPPLEIPFGQSALSAMSNGATGSIALTVTGATIEPKNRTLRVFFDLEESPSLGIKAEAETKITISTLRLAAPAPLPGTVSRIEGASHVAEWVLPAAFDDSRLTNAQWQVDFNQAGKREHRVLGQVVTLAVLPHYTDPMNRKSDWEYRILLKPVQLPPPGAKTK